MIKEKLLQPDAIVTGNGAVSGKNRLILRRSRPEKQRDNEKIKIVAETAATLSHEINNPLMVITACVESILKSHSTLSDDIIDKLRAIASSAGRIKDVTEKLIRAETLTYRDTACGRMINLGNSIEEKT